MLDHPNTTQKRYYNCEAFPMFIDRGFLYMFPEMKNLADAQSDTEMMHIFIHDILHLWPLSQPHTQQTKGTVLHPGPQGRITILTKQHPG